MAEKATRVADELDELRAEVERLTTALEEAKALIGESIEEGAGTIREKAEDLGARAQEGWKELEKQIVENPVPSALIALGLGFLIARLLTR
jgi:hypothetical protein